MKVKALFLLFTFLLNSALGLNCALHKDSDCCDDAAEHHQDLTIQNQPGHLWLTLIAQEDACCQNAVNNFASLAKLVPQPVKKCTPVQVAYIRFAFPCNSKLLPTFKVAHQSLIDQRQHPPTPDIRITIQSFLV